MRQFNIHQAKARFSKLVNAAAAGEEILIAKAGVPVARLVPLAPASRPRRKGLLEGRIKLNPEFDQPLPGGTARLFEGRDPT